MKNKSLGLYNIIDTKGINKSINKDIPLAEIDEISDDELVRTHDL